MPVPVTQPGRRLEFLDGIRGVAAVVVVIGHVGESTSAGFARWTLQWFSPGRAGVCAFFLVSGFVIPMSLERARGLGDFAISRVCRLYPMYWASLAAVVVLGALGAAVVPADFDARLPAAALVNLTMLQELVGVPHAIGVYYTLTIELVWYVACAALFALGWLHATERLAWVGLAGLAVVGVGVPVFLDRHVPFSTGFYLVTMLFGTAVARHTAGALSTSSLVRLGCAAAAVAIAGSWANYVEVPGPGDPDGALGFSAAVLPWVVAYGVFLLAYVLRSRRRLFPRPAVWLGVVSYSVYLLHPVVLGLVIGTDTAPEPFPTLLVVLVGSVAVAAVTQRSIEVPGQALGRRWRAATFRP